jgi:hypothetical protein
MMHASSLVDDLQELLADTTLPMKSIPELQFLDNKLDDENVGKRFGKQ